MAGEELESETRTRTARFRPHPPALQPDRQNGKSDVLPEVYSNNYSLEILFLVITGWTGAEGDSV